MTYFCLSSQKAALNIARPKGMLSGADCIVTGIAGSNGSGSIRPRDIRHWQLHVLGNWTDLKNWCLQGTVVMQLVP